ncbi:MAG: hypothetical protein KJ558_00715 [Gammaproteobacteria bacterium]|nr:hypothetical protein [Gammaproteobacteria bacterium]MBU1653358.1 hypothetical protein [Gammaproteobacteria bacterium]MBU1962785.1 hypothetical protein [Gammaproteobacteria bacterium]
MYCLVQIGVISTVEAEMSDSILDLDDTLFGSYLQESDDLIGAIHAAKKFCFFNQSFEVTICRLYAENLAKGYVDGLYQLIKSIYPEDVVHDFFRTRDNPRCLRIWEGLANPAIYENKECWESYLKTTDLTEQAEDCLKFYCDRWLPGIEQEHDLFPAVFFSICFLMKYRPDSNHIKRVALVSPSRGPEFFAIDLWLQRKAGEFCFHEYGIKFLKDNLKSIREELLQYLLAKTKPTDPVTKALNRLITEKMGPPLPAALLAQILDMDNKYTQGDF